MAPKTTTKVLKLIHKTGVLRPRDLERQGIPRVYLQRLQERGLVQRIGHGLYTLTEAPLTEGHSLAEACKRIPRGVVCLLSALRFHGLTNQNPFEVWMAVPGKAWRPRFKSPPIHLVFASGAPFREGIEEHRIEGVLVRVYGAAKTVADCFRYRNKIGVDVAVEALREYHGRHPKKLDAVWKFAEIDRVARVIRPYLESLR